MSGSPLPGERGNIVFAGHRDTFFRALRNVRNHDVITVTTPSGTHRYTVESTSVVDPDQTSVLEPTPASTLTLVTCYPFRFIGQAPQRFVVRGREMSEVAQGTSEPTRVRRNRSLTVAARKGTSTSSPMREKRDAAVQAPSVSAGTAAPSKPTHRKFNPVRFFKKLRF